MEERTSEGAVLLLHLLGKETMMLCLFLQAEV